MIQLEYINEELCSSCQDCCHLYKGRLMESPFIDRTKGDFFEQGLQLYGVRPLVDPLYEQVEYCEFHDPSIGCIIEREKRPILCRNYTCPKLLQDFKEIRKVYLEEKARDMKPTKLVFNEDHTRVNYTSDDIDIEEFKAIIIKRFEICKSCPELKYKNGIPRCGTGCCSFLDRMHKIYPLDDEGKAITQINSANGAYFYVCPLKKW